MVTGSCYRIGPQTCSRSWVSLTGCIIGTKADETAAATMADWARMISVVGYSFTLVAFHYVNKQCHTISCHFFVWICNS